MSNKETLLLRLRDAEGRTHEEMYMSVLALDEEFKGNPPELDQEFVRSMKYLTHLFGGWELTDESWRYRIKEIVNGEYPLAKLPDHVRALAKELYYDPKN